MASIKRDDWFRKDYHPTYFDDEEEDIFTSEVDNSIDQESSDQSPPTTINAFQLIGMFSCLDLSGFFEKEDISEKKIRFTTNQYSTKEDIFKQMEFLVTEMGFLIHRKDGRVFFFFLLFIFLKLLLNFLIIIYHVVNLFYFFHLNYFYIFFQLKK
ncbi:hypothetical protein IC582_027072 [Cucumis melo]